MVAALRAKRASVRGEKATVPNKAHGTDTGPRSNSLDCLADAALAAGSDEEAAAPRHMRNAKRNASLRMSAQAAAAKLPMAQLAGLYGKLHSWHWISTCAARLGCFQKLKAHNTCGMGIIYILVRVHCCKTFESTLKKVPRSSSILCSAFVFAVSEPHQVVNTCSTLFFCSCNLAICLALQRQLHFLANPCLYNYHLQ